MEVEFSLGPVGQLRLGVADLDRSDAFYAEQLGLRRLFRDGARASFDCGETRLLLEESADYAVVRPASPIYFRVSDIVTARRELEGRGVRFIDQIQMVASMGEVDVWITSFVDPDGHRLALMSEGPTGFQP
jgi:methylmalonyl-CoA/ethylmalonyl-CoA epimerase